MMMAGIPGDSQTAEPLLEVSGLTTSFPAGAGRTTVVDDVSFRVAPGTITGIVGESGSGKSVSVKSVLGLVGRPGRVEAGTARFASSRGPVDLITCPRSVRRGVLGTDIGFIIQNPFGALNAVTRIRDQFITVLRASRALAGRPRKELADLAEETLRQVGINDPKRVLDGYPHQLSGGMAQRVVIAFALARRPRLLVADEPTTALDLTVQRQILDVMAERAAELGASVLLITHDLGVVAHYCRDAYVFYRGKVVEHGTVADIFHNTRHDYTRRLIAASGGAQRQPSGEETS
jgi:peptide/nickel transport system ATP-binding protein